jgi:hypothetical protein
MGHFLTRSAAVVMTEQKPLIRAIVHPATYLRSVVHAAWFANSERAAPIRRTHVEARCASWA